MESSPAPSDRPTGAMGLESHQMRALLAMVGVALLLNYVETMIVPGIPTIQKDFNTSSSVVAWVTSAFLIVGSAVAPLFGRLGDSRGKKRMFLFALGFYTFGVGLGGFSPSVYFLIAARAIQGIGFAIVPLSLAIIAETFPRERISTAQGVISATFAIGAAAGLVIGAYIVQDVGWQWAFHSAFILSIVLFVLVARFLPSGHPGNKQKVNFATTFMLMAGVSLLLLYLTEAPFEGWLSLYDLTALAAGVLITLGFFISEARSSNPLIQLSLLRIRNVLVANLIGIISGGAMFLLFWAVIYYTESPVPFGLGLDTIAAGLTLAPATVLMLVAGPGLGRLVKRNGPKPTILLGAGISLVGLVLFLTYRSTPTDVTIDTAISLLGAISIIIPIVNMVSISLPKETVGTGLGLNTMLRNIGGAVGPVIATTIMSTYYVQPLGSPVTFPTAAAFNYIFYTGMAFMAVGIVVALTAKNYTFRE